MKRFTLACVLTIAAITGFALATPAANASAKECSNATLVGTFAEKDNGYIMNPPPAAASLFAGLNLDTFDGKGTITAVGISSLDGTVGGQTESGTYTVNADCTGTYQVVINPGGFTANAFFVIDDNGNEIQIMVTNQGNVITCTARKQFPSGSER